MTSNVPEIRFEGYDGEWEKKNILNNVQDVLDYREKSPAKFGMEWGDSGYLVLSALNVKDGYIDKTIEAKYGSKKLFEKWMGKERLCKGDVVFTTEAPLGNVAQIPDEQDYILNQRAVAFKLKHKKMTNDFFAYTLRSPRFQSILLMKSSGGTAKGIGMKEFSKLSIVLPECIKEQQAIGSFFKELDDRIALQQTSLASLKETKQGFLQKMFPKKGETVPELRFDGFDEEWENTSLGNVITHRGGTAIEKYFNDNGEYKVISIGSYGLESKYIDQGIRADKNDVTQNRVIQSGEFAMVLNDKTTSGDIIGRSLLIDEDDKYVINQRTEIISLSEWMDSQYMYTYLNTIFREFVKSIAQGGTQIYVNFSAVKKLKVQFPKLPEQRAIGSFFKELDDLIELEERELELLQETKKAFLQKMFV